MLASGASLALAVMADRASQDDAHTAAVQEDLAIEAAEAGRRRRDLADLDTTTTADGADTTTYNTSPYNTGTYGGGADPAGADGGDSTGWED